MTKNIDANYYGPVSGAVGTQNNFFGAPSADELAASYYRQTAKACEGLTLAAVKPVGENRENASADDVYVAPDVRVIDEGKADKKSANLERESRRVPLRECLNSDDIAMRCLVLTAQSGFGKSTAVNVRVVEIAKGATPWLMLRLPSLQQQTLAQDNESNTGSVERALQKDILAKLKCGETDSIRIADAVINRLDAAPGVILFDALDEVPQGERTDVIACVRTFLNDREKKQPNKHRVLITSRPYAFAEHAQQFAKDKFKHIKLAEFTPAQQEKLIGKWFVPPDKSPAIGHALIEQINTARSDARPDQTAIAALMTEPMLLTYACMLAHARAPAEGAAVTAPLPPTRHELFDGVVRLMLEEWDPRRKHGAVETFVPLFSATTDKPSVLRQVLERAALEELTEGASFVAVEAALEEWKKSLAQQFAARNLSRERFVFWLDESMPIDMPVRAHTVVDWLAQRSGLLQAVREVHGVRFVLQAQLRDFLAVGGLRASVSDDYALVDAMLAKLRTQPQWYRPMMTMVLARLQGEARELTYAINGILAPRDDSSDGLAHAHEILHFVIAWANAFGEAGPSSRKSAVLEPALTKLRHRCLELVTAPAEGKPPIELRAEAADALGLIGDPRFDPERWHLPTIRMRSIADEPIPGFVRIEAGEFVMGNEREENNPPHKVLIDHPFYIARYATTVAQFRHFVDEGGYEEIQWWDDDGLLWLSGEYDMRVQDNEHLRWLRGRPTLERRHPVSWSHQLQSPSSPVVGVSWFESRAFVLWLRHSLHNALLDASLADYVVRLPTDPQWERAARGTSDGKGHDDRRWPWGNDEEEAPTYANVNRVLNRIAAVGLYEPTGLALFDMAGSVSEWMDNAHRPANGVRFDRVLRDHVWQHSTKSRDSESLSLRGGSWVSWSARTSCSYRDGNLPADWSMDIGFRAVLSLAGK